MSKNDALKVINRMCRMLVDETMQVPTNNTIDDMVDRALEVTRIANCLYKTVNEYSKMEQTNRFAEEDWFD